MKEQFVSYEIALKLKELGFDEPCFGFWYVSQINNSCIELRYGMCVFKNTSTELSKYPKNVLAPLLQQVIDWFREVKNINVEVWYDNTQDDGFPWLYEIYIDNKEHQHDGSYYDSFYEAREQAILKAIELIKK